jgi:hypothetical protein
LNTTALLRTELSAEADSGFPRLRRIPKTKVVQFLDYFADLNPGDRSELLDALAARAAVLIHPGPASGFPPAPAFDRYWNAVNSRGLFSGGYRYCDVKFLASVPRIKEFGGYGGWIENHQRPWVSERALQPREDLLPDLGLLTPAPGPELRKRVKEALQAGGLTAAVTKGAEHQYVHSSGAVVHVDFGSRMGQLCYWVRAAGDPASFRGLSYESLWGQPGGWDYLTQENAARSVAVLPELIDYLARLPERMK